MLETEPHIEQERADIQAYFIFKFFLFSHSFGRCVIITRALNSRNGSCYTELVS